MSSQLEFPAVVEHPSDHWSQRRWYGLTGAAWVQVGTITALMAGLFWPNLRRLWLKTNPINGEANWQHAMAVPLVGLYYLYLNRESLFSSKPAKPTRFLWRALGTWIQLNLAIAGLIFFTIVYYAAAYDSPAKQAAIFGASALAGLASLAAVLLAHSKSANRNARQQGALVPMINAVADRSAKWFGVYVLLWGILFYAWGIWPGQNDFFKDCAMVVTLFGVVLLLSGWGAMRIAWFPIAFLVVAIPWPGLMYSRIAVPLQEIAATAAVWTLKATGVEAVRQGTKLVIGEGDRQQYLNVAEACAGLKSLMTFVFIGGAVAFLSSRVLWQKLLIAASAVPIAIFCNMFRVSGQGILHHYASEKWSESFAHQFVGMIMLLPAFFLILGVGWVLDHLFIEEVDKRALRTAEAAKAGKEPQVITIPSSPAPAISGAAAVAGAAVAKTTATANAASDSGQLAAAAARLAATHQRRPARGTPARPAGRPSSGGPQGDQRRSQ